MLSKNYWFLLAKKTAYNPQSNSRFERFYRTLKEALKLAKIKVLRALPVVLGIQIKLDEIRISALSATTCLDVLIPISRVNKQ